MNQQQFPDEFESSSGTLGALLKTSLIDFPAHVSSVYFLTGCNLRCPYCYNFSLAQSTESKENLVSPDDVLRHLQKRKAVLSGFVISGGEPLLSSALPYLIKSAKELGYKIKLDTNGTLPEKLLRIVSDSELCPDFIAMDIKTSPKNYRLLSMSDNGKINLEEKITQSIQILSNLPSQKREWRTVLVPQLVKSDDIENMAHLLPRDASWQFARFKNTSCLNPEYNGSPLYTESEINALIASARKTIPGASLR